MFIDVQLTLLIAISCAGAFVAHLYQRRADAIAANLSPEDRDLFDTRYRSAAERSGMPPKFDDLARATDRVRGARTGVMVIVGIAILFVIL